MVQIINVKPEKEGIFIEYLTNGIKISTLVKDTDNLTPQEIAEKGYAEVKPYIDMELRRLGKNTDHVLPAVKDEVIRIELFGITDLEFTEGQQAMELQLRCTGHTKYGKAVDLRNEAAFSLTGSVRGISVACNILTIAPEESCVTAVTAEYGMLGYQKEFHIRYISLQEIEERNAQAEQEAEARQAQELEEARQSRITELQNDCNRDILGGFTVSVKEEERTFGFEWDDQINLISQLAIFTANPTAMEVAWKCKGLEGMVDIYTKDEFLMICAAAEISKRGKMERFWGLKQVVLESQAIEEVMQIVW